MKTTQRGFTLVEIAIVLVIIGLLLGGVLKGQEMIIQAKIKNAIADYSGISAAYHGYLDRYRAIPGDDNGAGRWASTGTVNTSTGGNRTLDGKFNADCSAAAGAATPETCLWWQHLRLSGFIAGSGHAQPSNAFNGMLGVQTADGLNPTVGPALGAFTSLIICSSNLPDKVAIAVDVQMDDGKVNDGSLRGAKISGTSDITSATTVPTAYEESGTNFYTLCRAF